MKTNTREVVPFLFPLVSNEYSGFIKLNSKFFPKSQIFRAVRCSEWQNTKPQQKFKLTPLRHANDGDVFSVQNIIGGIQTIIK